MGHDPQAVWRYTPRQISGFVGFAARRLKREAAQALSLQSMAARGDPKALRKQIKDLEK